MPLPAGLPTHPPIPFTLRKSEAPPAFGSTRLDSAQMGVIQLQLASFNASLGSAAAGLVWTGLARIGLRQSSQQLRAASRSESTSTSKSGS